MVTEERKGIIAICVMVVPRTSQEKVGPQCASSCTHPQPLSQKTTVWRDERQRAEEKKGCYYPHFTERELRPRGLVTPPREAGL